VSSYREVEELMNKSEKQKTKDLVEDLRRALPPQYRGLASDVDKLYGELRRSQSARDSQRDTEFAQKLAAARAEMQAQCDLYTKELASGLAAEFNHRHDKAEAVRQDELKRFCEELNENIRDLDATHTCMSGGLETYMFCDDSDEETMAPLAMAALMALADWVRGGDTDVIYLDEATGYSFLVCKACPRGPTILVGVPRREIERLKNPIPTKKLRRTARKLVERKVFLSIPGG
jgi:hypothetical protein